MVSIPEAEIERLKNEVSVERLGEAAAIELKRGGRDRLGRCPFPEGNTASLVEKPAKNGSGLSPRNSKTRPHRAHRSAEPAPGARRRVRGSWRGVAIRATIAPILSCGDAHGQLCLV